MEKISISKSFDEFIKIIRSSRKTITVHFVKSMITRLVNALISNLYRMKIKSSIQKINWLDDLHLNLWYEEWIWFIDRALINQIFSKRSTKKD